MVAIKKIAGLIAGVSAVAVFGVAVAQGVPPNPYVSNPALGAGQQSSHMTSMGETGVPWLGNQPALAQVVQPMQQPMAQVAPAPAPYIAQAPAPVVEQQQMGAAPAPMAAEQPVELVARADRG
jgi:hypothetical protein